MGVRTRFRLAGWGTNGRSMGGGLKSDDCGSAGACACVLEDVLAEGALGRVAIVGLDAAARSITAFGSTNSTAIGSKSNFTFAV